MRTRARIRMTGTVRRAGGEVQDVSHDRPGPVGPLMWRAFVVSIAYPESTMQQGPRMTNDSCDTVVFDLGGVLIDC